MMAIRWVLLGTALALVGCQGNIADLTPGGDDDTGSVGDDDVGDDDIGDDDIGDDDVGDDDTETDDDDDAEAEVWCWMIAPTHNGTVAVIEVDMQSGSWSLVGEFGSGFGTSLHTEGLARLGDSLIMSADTGDDYNWVEIDMAGGGVTIGSGSWGGPVSVSAGELIRDCGGDLCRYPDFAALDSSSPSSQVPANFWGERIAGTDTEIYVAWHSTEELDIHDAFNACWTDDIELEDWDGWVYGMSVVGDRIFLKGNEDRIAGFDRYTGALLVDHTVTMDEYPWGASGLWCEAR